MSESSSSLVHSVEKTVAVLLRNEAGLLSGHITVVMPTYQNVTVPVGPNLTEAEYRKELQETLEAFDASPASVYGYTYFTESAFQSHVIGR